MKKRNAICSISLLALLIAACATPPPVVEPEPEPEPVYVEPEIVVTRYSPPKRKVETRMKDVLVRDAAYHGSTMQRVAQAAYTPIQTREDLNGHLDGLAGVFTQRTGAGLLSYGGLIAAQNPAFVDSIIDRATAEGADTLVSKLYSDPNYALTFAGAYDAARDIQAAWQDDISTFDSAAAAIKSQSYELQKDPKWKNMRAGNRKARLTKFKDAQKYSVTLPQSSQRSIAAAGTVLSTDYDGAARSAAFWQAYGKAGKPASYSNEATVSVNAAKALTLGALDVLGTSGKNSSTWIANYTVDVGLNRCLNWARLHTEQCLAAGHFKFEDAFCVAEHELKDVSECLSEGGY
ncbi:hypothetical protein [Robiginitomaculum antarcticum]|uniref:hypothetical protein n=1 Tax=Robiginitomaculum antarcticum TaxID=437507 RepID=UPI000367FD65|nr:hypothetical protein [Robiginitomaculum antarcticum]